MSMKIDLIKMKEIVKEELDRVYITTDGKSWANQSQAYDHQTILNKIKLID